MTPFTDNPRGCGSFTTSTGGTRARSRGCPMRSSSCRGSGRGRARGRGRGGSCGSARPSCCAGACRAPAPAPTWTSTTTRRCVRAPPCRGWRGSGDVVFLQTGTLTSYSVISGLESIAAGQAWIFSSDFQGLFMRRCSRSLHLSSCSTTSSQVKRSSSWRTPSCHKWRWYPNKWQGVK